MTLISFCLFGHLYRTRISFVITEFVHGSQLSQLVNIFM